MPAPAAAAVYSSFNAEQFARLLANEDSAPRVAVTAQHHLIPGAAFARAGALDGDAVDLAVVVTTPQSVLASVAGVFGGAPCDRATLYAEVDAFAAAVAALPARLVFVANWIAPRRYAGGVLALDARFGLDGVLASANLRLSDALARHPTRHVLNATGWQAVLGERAHSTKNWLLTKDPYSFDLWKMAVADVKNALAAFSGGAKRLIVLDLDNTLWGGEVGDAGVDGLRIGGHDPQGEAFAAFQDELLALARRGVILAVASKNDERVALEAMDAHPEQRIRSTDLAGWIIDWEDKGGNVRTLCERIGIAPSDAVFIDDNPAERRAVAAALPEMTVPEWPANPLLYVDALRRIDLFDVPEVTDEDLSRSRTYAAARAFRASGVKAELATRIDVRPLDASDFPRALQLLNKTNQMNLATRRFVADELRAWLAAGERTAWTVRVSDAYGDYGLTGVLMLDFGAEECRITDFAMSCRVMSRGVEERMLRVAADEARARGCRVVAAHFLPTERNEPMRRFLVERSGLASADGTRFVLATSGEERMPA